MLKVLLFSNFTIIIRYVFAFYSKNPTAIQDDFWTFFLHLWAIGNYSEYSSIAVFFNLGSVVILLGSAKYLKISQLGKLRLAIVNRYKGSDNFFEGF